MEVLAGKQGVICFWPRRDSANLWRAWTPCCLRPVDERLHQHSYGRTPAEGMPCKWRGAEERRHTIDRMRLEWSRMCDPHPKKQQPVLWGHKHRPNHLRPLSQRSSCHATRHSMSDLHSDSASHISIPVEVPSLAMPFAWARSAHGMYKMISIT